MVSAEAAGVSIVGNRVDNSMAILCRRSSGLGYASPNQGYGTLGRASATTPESVLSSVSLAPATASLTRHDAGQRIAR